MAGVAAVGLVVQCNGGSCISCKSSKVDHTAAVARDQRQRVVETNKHLDGGFQSVERQQLQWLHDSNNANAHRHRSSAMAEPQFRPRMDRAQYG